MKNLTKKIIPLILVIVMILGMSTMCVNATIYYSSTLGLVMNEEYHIMNSVTKKFLSVNPNATSIYDTVTIYDDVSVDVRCAQWYFYQTNGNFLILNEYYSNGSGIGIYGDTPVLMSNAYNMGDTCQFNIRRVSYSADKTEQGRYTIMNGSYYLRCNSTGELSITSTYDANCLWTFMRVDKSKASLYTFCYADSNCTDIENKPYYNTLENAYLFSTTMAKMGYVATCSTNDDAGSAYSSLLDNDIFIYRGHGNRGLIAFHSTADITNGYIKASNNVTTNGSPSYVVNSPSVDLSSARCVLYIGCNTGSYHSLGANLVEATYQQGAHFVMGTKRVMNRADDDEFLKCFLQEIYDGANLYDAVENAIVAVGSVRVKNEETNQWETVERFPAYYVGDGDQYLW